MKKLLLGLVGAIALLTVYRQALADVFIQTGADGSTHIDTDGVSVQTGQGEPQVSVDGQSYGSAYGSGGNQSYSYSSSSSSSSSGSSTTRSYSSSSSSGSHSVSQMRVDIPVGSLAETDYVLMLTGSGIGGSVAVNDQLVATLGSSATSVKLNPYLRWGENTIRIFGTGTLSLDLALVTAPLGYSPYWSNGQVVGASQILTRHSQQQSGGGDWQSTLAIVAN